MSQETLGNTKAEKIQAIKDLTPPEIHEILLPMLQAGEPLLPDDIALIQARAAALMEEDATWTVQETLINAATERFKARENIGGPRTAIIDAGGVVQDVVSPEESGKAMQAAAEDARGA